MRKRLVIFFCLVVSGCDKDKSSVEEVAASIASHEKMRLALLEVKEQTDQTNPFLGRGNVDEGRAILATLSPDVPAHVRARVLGELGWAELRYGLERDAIESLEEANRLFRASAEGRGTAESRKAESTLALAYLRLAETQNCCARPNPESCIFPLRGEAIHERKEGAEKALPILLKMASESRPEVGWYEELCWLANIAQMTLGRPLSELPEAVRLPEMVATGNFPEFPNISERAGINTFGLSGGAVMDDFDGDGFYDLIVSQWDTSQSTDYFRNRGDGTFEKMSEAANLSGALGGLNMKQGDFDNDGDLDVYVMRGAWMGQHGRHPNSLLRNDGVDQSTGAVVFTDVTFAVGLGDHHYPSQTSDWADFDLDGDLDLFVGNEASQDCDFPCQLFRNDGQDQKGIHRFTDVAKEAGIEVFAKVKGAVWGDYDGDRYPDLFLSCLDEPNRLFRNMGGDSFVDVTTEKGVEKQERSFPAWFWDFNNDGLLDIFASSYMGIPMEIFVHSHGGEIEEESKARLYQNDGRGGFVEVSEEVGLTMPMLPMGSNFGDVMNDGFPDMYLGTGNPSYGSIVPNIFLSNEGGQFVDRTIATRLGHLQKGHAVSFADFDRDGDLDIFEQMGGAYRGDPYYDALYENPGVGNSWISIRLRGRQSNSFGVGSRIKVTLSGDDGTKRSIYQWMNSGGSFGANPLESHFGLGKGRIVESIEVFWPKTGKTQKLGETPINRRIVITEQ